MGLFKSISGTFNALTNSIQHMGGKDSRIITQMVQEFKDRSRAEIDQWMAALAAAEDTEEPNWQPLQDLYDKLQPDGHLQGVLAIRRAAVLSNRFYVQDKDGQERPEKTKLLQTRWFFGFLRNVIDAAFYGYSVQELGDLNTFKWDLLPRRNCIPEWGYFKLVAGDAAKGVHYSSPEYADRIIETTGSEPFGVFNFIVPQLIWKRNAQQTWADFGERFGIPFISTTTSEERPVELAKIQAMMEKMGQAAQAVFPTGTGVTVHDNATKGDPYNIFDRQIDRTNSEISKCLLGGTMVVDPGSSYSQSEVHERTLDKKVAEGDRKNCEFAVNAKLLPILAAHGLPFADGDTLIFDRTEKLGMAEHWGIIKDALEHYDIPDEWVSKRFNFPIEGRKQPQNAGMAPQTAKPKAKAAFTANFS